MNRTEKKKSQRGRRPLKNASGRIPPTINQHKYICRCTSGTQPATAIAINAQTATGLVTASGVSTGLYDMEFNFTQYGCLVSIGGVGIQNMNFQNAGNLAALYDQYRIDKVELEIFFSNNTSSVGTPSTTLPIITIVNDYDDSNSITLLRANSYTNAVNWQCGRGSSGFAFKRVLKPNVDTLVYNGVTSAYARSPPVFMDTATNNVPHYGVKMVVDTIVPTAASTVLGYLSFRVSSHMTYREVT